MLDLCQSGDKSLCVKAGEPWKSLKHFVRNYPGSPTGFRCFGRAQLHLQTKNSESPGSVGKWPWQEGVPSHACAAGIHPRAGIDSGVQGASSAFRAFSAWSTSLLLPAHCKNPLLVWQVFSPAHISGISIHISLKEGVDVLGLDGQSTRTASYFVQTCERNGGLPMLSRSFFSVPILWGSVALKLHQFYVYSISSTISCCTCFVSEWTRVKISNWVDSWICR